MQCKRFVNMMKVVHVDGKLFHKNTNCSKFYIGKWEKDTYWSVKCKRFIIKVMFLAAVTCSGWDLHKNCIFNGQLGIWPFFYTLMQSNPAEIAQLVHQSPSQSNRWRVRAIKNFLLQKCCRLYDRNGYLWQLLARSISSKKMRLCILHPPMKNLSKYHLILVWIPTRFVSRQIALTWRYWMWDSSTRYSP